VRTRADWAGWWEQEGRRRKAVEDLYRESHAKEASWSIPGFCGVCSKASLFRFTKAAAGVVAFRDSLLCPTCGLSSLQRSAMSRMADLLPVGQRWVHILLHGPGGALLERMRGTFAGMEVAHLDKPRVPQESESLDLYYAHEVYHQVPDLDRSLADAKEALVPKGKLFITVPFTHSEKTVPAKSGAVRDLGWDLVDSIRAAGFQDAYGIASHSFHYGLLGDGGLIAFVGEK
jgi:hypothetical protein